MFYVMCCSHVTVSRQNNFLKRMNKDTVLPRARLVNVVEKEMKRKGILELMFIGEKSAITMPKSENTHTYCNLLQMYVRCPTGNRKFSLKILIERRNS